MKKLFWSAIALSLVIAAPAIAGNVKTGNVSSGANNAAPINSLNNSISVLSVVTGDSSIKNSGDNSYFYGSSNAGAIAGAFNFNGNQLPSVILPEGAVEIPAGSIGATFVGANSFYDRYSIMPTVTHNDIGSITPTTGSGTEAIVNVY